MTRRFKSLAGLVSMTALAALASAACGEASLKVSTPTPTPNQSVDCTFRGGVMETFVTRDCGNSSCHIEPGAAQLTLVSETMSEDEVYRLLLDSGGSSQRNSDCANEGPECADDPTSATGNCCNRTVRRNKPANSLLLQKPFSDNPITHGGGKAFGSDQDENYLSVKCWIEDNAPNN